ncbi:MAG: hypothetical protein GVY34_01750 [Alphaproteobacteria bacterium]|jgi:hypothetical protein|nr:hypothetical protein [Alphaproteobacteria bacterium]
MFLSRICQSTLAVVVIVGLGACSLNPMARPMPAAPAPTGSAPDPAPAAGTTGAESACTAAGRERGLEVLGVVSARDVSGANGASERDVMLRVARNGTQLDVRCNYQPDSGVARIMLI